MIKAFIDTNVFVHWIILSKMKVKRPDDKDLWKEFTKIKPSFELIETIRNINLRDFSFFTSQLALAEIFYALLDEYKCRQMYLDGVPLSSWQRVKETVNLTNDDIKALTTDIKKFLDDFYIFGPSNEAKKISLLQEPMNYDLISKLVLKKKIRTHDAVLLSTAAHFDCKYFATEDRVRKIKLDEIDIVHPQRLLQIIKQNNKLQTDKIN
jgi:hypothetical protein